MSTYYVNCDVKILYLLCDVQSFLTDDGVTFYHHFNFFSLLPPPTPTPTFFLFSSPPPLLHFDKKLFSVFLSLMQLTEVLLLREREVCVCVGGGGGVSYFIYRSVSCTGSPRERVWGGGGGGAIQTHECLKRTLILIGLVYT